MLKRLRAKLQCAFTGSTIAEVDWHSGRCVRIPGQYPSQERSLWWRFWQTVRSS